MSTMHDTGKLDDLIITTIDSIKGYEHSAEHADARRYAGFFRAMAGERRGVVELLQEQSRALGGTPADYGSTAATIHRRWEDLRHALGGGDAALVKEVERGEDYLKEEYERALNDGITSPETLAVIRRAYESVVRGHDRASHLKHELEAAD
ncbi:PA2169 family four-helix-bundle protein [Sphingomonas sp. LB-2]|uniref:PA2169 family four-helix-bundle protein n=1 Tax=Sphingomonas caeni TaxID=2984949 RepID=UPI0022320490|nr:PA2169 family four-helix-bundle protein [Sphingomonas caeni]MCW3848311.1 PA2169 family four-helix-bundle protein [Sphingomonas caeni]